MCSTGNATQYSVMPYMGKQSKKQWTYVHVYIADSFCGIPETNKTL